MVDRLWGGKWSRLVEQLEFRRVIADRLFELSVLLFDHRLRLLLLIVTILNVLHQDRTHGLIQLRIGTGKVAIKTCEYPM